MFSHLPARQSASFLLRPLPARHQPPPVAYLVLPLLLPLLELQAEGELLQGRAVQRVLGALELDDLVEDGPQLVQQWLRCDTEETMTILNSSWNVGWFVFLLGRQAEIHSMTNIDITWKWKKKIPQIWPGGQSLTPIVSKILKELRWCCISSAIVPPAVLMFASSGAAFRQLQQTGATGTNHRYNHRCSTSAAILLQSTDVAGTNDESSGWVWGVACQFTLWVLVCFSFFFCFILFVICYWIVFWL